MWRAAIVLAATALPAWGAERAPREWSVGVRGGIDLSGRAIGYVDASAGWAPVWTPRTGIELSLGAAAGLAALAGGGAWGALVHVGFAARATFQRLLFVGASLSEAVLGERELGEHDFGCNLEFISGFELGVRVDEQLAVLARVQHISNGNVARVNPGLEHLLIGLDWSF